MSAPANKRAKVSASGIPSLFNDLAKIGVAESIVDASWKIIKELELCQEQFSPSETGIVEESDESMLSLYSGGELGALLSPDVIYALKRCIKGTASGEQTTRLAFSTCFTLLLTRFKMNILVPVVWKWINALLSPSHLFGTSSLSRSEQTLVYTSKLGSILALIEADILHDQVEVCLEIVSELAGIAKSRSFLRLSALNAMKDLACLNMNAEKVTDLIEELPLSADLIFVFDDLLEKKRKFKELLPEVPLLNNYGLITDLLIDTISISSDMHPLWTKMLDHFANNPTSIDLFWKSQIDSKLFSSDSVEKRLIGFKLSDHLFESHSLIIFSDNFIQNFESLAINLTIKGKKDLPLTQSVKRLLEKIAQDDGLLAQFTAHSEMFKRLLDYPNWFLTEILSKPCGSEFAVSLINSALNNASDDSLVVAKVVDKAISLVSMKQISRDSREIILDTVMNICLRSSKLDNMNISRIQAALAQLSKVQSVASTIDWFSKWLKRHMIDSDPVIVILSEKIEKVQKRLKKLKSGLETPDALIDSLDLLLRLFAIWTYIEPNIVSDSVEDVESIIKKLKKSSESSRHIEVLTDILLRLLSFPSSFLRLCTDQIFELIIPQLNIPSIDLIVNVLETKPKDPSILEQEYSDIEESNESESEEDLLQSSDTSVIKCDSKGIISDDQGSDPDIYLDDADQEELAAFDSKLVEIFKLKKQAKKSSAMSEKALLDFKNRIINWVGILSKHVEKLSPSTVTVHLLVSLIKAVFLNSLRSPAVANRLSELTGKISPFSDPQRVIQPGEIELVSNNIVELIETDYWKSSLTMNLCMKVLWNMSKCLDPLDQNCLITKIIQAMWNMGATSKVVQKSSFYSHFAFWLSKSDSSLLCLFTSTSWADEVFHFQKQAKNFILELILRLLKQITSQVANEKSCLPAICTLLKQEASSANNLFLKASKVHLDILIFIRQCQKLRALCDNESLECLELYKAKLDVNGLNFLQQKLK